MKKIEVFIQGEGLPDTALVEVAEGCRIRDVVDAARAKGLDACERESAVFFEDSDESIDPERTLEDAGVGHRKRLHVHRCRKVAVTVNFNERQAEREFPPSATIKRVKAWAAREFDLSKVDASEHALQVCGSPERPDEDQHLGCLVARPGCSVCFDLVAKQRVEG